METLFPFPISCGFEPRHQHKKARLSKTGSWHQSKRDVVKLITSPMAPTMAPTKAANLHPTNFGAEPRPDIYADASSPAGGGSVLASAASET